MIEKLHFTLSIQELEADGQYSQAEHHFTEAQDWKAAVNMYRNNDLWEDSYRVSQIFCRRFLFTPVSCINQVLHCYKVHLIYQPIVGSAPFIFMCLKSSE